ncbi:kelch domain-containing protein 3-like [Corticium candelabrum]|uniref:kelch domain-containing protein 3-like n=1 Tax=Corticium candelabrum TaxID=121492 RepID=UPI002E25BEFC|nr:kelch domain-containing protein 3-like [Corticium candelabrum]
MARWIANVDNGLKRVNQAVVHIKGTPLVLSFGGYCNGFDQLQYMDSHAFNLKTYLWTELTPARDSTESNDKSDDEISTYLPDKRFGHTATACGHQVYIIGGQKSHHPLVNVEMFDVITKKWKRLEPRGTPEPRAGHTACLHGGKIYVFGGCKGLLFLNSMDVFDPLDGCWTQLDTADPPLYRDFHTATTVDHVMYIFGGRSDVCAPLYTNTPYYPSDLFKFDFTTNSWYLVAFLGGNPPVGRRSHSAVARQKRIYIFGGYNGIYDEYFNDFHMFDTENLMWFQMVGIGGPCPTPRRRHGYCMIDENQMFIYGGTSCGLDDDNDDEEEFDDLSDVSILDFQPSLRTLAMIAVAKYKLSHSILPQSVQTELRCFTQKGISVS